MEYKIVKIDKGTHKKLKIRAAEEERNIEEVASDAINCYIEDKEGDNKCH